jgi:hypothetical protein
MRPLLLVALLLLLDAFYVVQSTTIQDEIPDLQRERLPFPRPNVDQSLLPPTSTEASQWTDSLRRSITDLEGDPVVVRSQKGRGASRAPAFPHHMRLLQATQAFTMQRRTANSPFSPRIQPGLMYRTRPLTYTQLTTGIQIRLGSGYLLMYEGAMNNRTGTTRAVENDVSAHHTNTTQHSTHRSRSHCPFLLCLPPAVSGVGQQ